MSFRRTMPRGLGAPNEWIRLGSAGMTARHGHESFVETPAETCVFHAKS